MTLDLMSNSPFVSQIKYKAIWKDNLVVNQTSLRTVFHRPLHLELTEWTLISKLAVLTFSSVDLKMGVLTSPLMRGVPLWEVENVEFS